MASGSGSLKIMRYMIIYWLNDLEVYPVLKLNNTIRLFDTLTSADEYTNELERSAKKNEEIEARVISIEGVKV